MLFTPACKFYTMLNFGKFRYIEKMARKVVFRSCLTTKNNHFVKVNQSSLVHHLYLLIKKKKVTLRKGQTRMTPWRWVKPG